MTSNLHVKLAGIALLLIAGCSINVHDSDRASSGDNGKHDEVTIKSPLGGLHVDTSKVDAKDTGMSVYPGARIKQKENDNDNKANVNIDTPWFGLKVVALTYDTDDSKEKVWAYYKKELSKYGKVLECRPGSPDMDIKASSDDKNQLTCRDDKNSKNHQGVNFDSDESLRVGTRDHQRVVGFKHAASGTEFSLVYIETHGGENDKA
jgi:hypothetical protein